MKIKKKWFAVLWMCLALCLVTLMVMAGKSRSNMLCQGVKVDLDGDNSVVFLDEQTIKTVISENGGAVGKMWSKVNLHKLEVALMKQPAIEKAKLFFDNENNLVVKVNERDPVARVFTLSGNSFFVDSSCHKIPVADAVVIRLPVFTSFTSDKHKLSKPDSSLLASVKNIANYVCRDSFWNAFISQINILPDRTFEVIPVIGNTTINIGGDDNLDDKFNRLYSFYKQVWTTVGVNKYERVDVRYRNQIVATKKGGLLAQQKDTSIVIPTTDKIINNKVFSIVNDTISYVKNKNNISEKKEMNQQSKTTKSKHI